MKRAFYISIWGLLALWLIPEVCGQHPQGRLAGYIETIQGSGTLLRPGTNVVLTTNAIYYPVYVGDRLSGSIAKTHITIRLVSGGIVDLKGVRTITMTNVAPPDLVRMQLKFNDIQSEYSIGGRQRGFPFKIYCPVAGDDEGDVIKTQIRLQGFTGVKWSSPLGTNKLTLVLRKPNSRDHKLDIVLEAEVEANRGEYNSPELVQILTDCRETSSGQLNLELRGPGMSERFYFSIFSKQEEAALSEELKACAARFDDKRDLFRYISKAAILRGHKLLYEAALQYDEALATLQGANASSFFLERAIAENEENGNTAHAEQLKVKLRAISPDH
jgi:hypothetical protein